VAGNKRRNTPTGAIEVGRLTHLAGHSDKLVAIAPVAINHIEAHKTNNDGARSTWRTQNGHAMTISERNARLDAGHSWRRHAIRVDDSSCRVGNKNQASLRINP